MKSIWKGAISFGLVSIPVQLFSATEERGVSFNQVHARDGGRIRYRRVCEKEGREVPYEEITKGYETADGHMIVLTDDDLASLPVASRKVIDVVAFVPQEEFDPIQFSRAYYVKATDPSAAKPYVLLREALGRSQRVAVVKVALRNRESPALLRVRDDVLVLQTMLWPDEVRPAAEMAPDGKVNVREQELAMADSFMEALSDFDPESFTDEYRTAVEELVAAKAAGVEPAMPEEEPEVSGRVIDLMAALEASVKAAKGEGGRAEGRAEPPKKRAPAKKTAAKKAPAQKAAAKSAAPRTAAAKKGAAKQPAAKKKAAPRKKTA